MDFTSIFDGKALTLEEFQARTKNMKLADQIGRASCRERVL